MALNQKKWLWLIGALLMVYAASRAWILPPLHDEAATFYHFIETGQIWGEGSLLDANNHLLNSFWGRFVYTAFGENYFLFRLSNVLLLGLYFWSIWQLTQYYTALWKRWIILLAIVGVPYVFDYFSYTRGYGMAIAFFSAALVYLQTWVKYKTIKACVLVLFFLFFAIFSNLIYLVPSLLIIGFIVAYQFFRFPVFSWSNRFATFILIALFYFSIRPFIAFSFKLREAGALYYGSLDGFWRVTGKSLCQYVLFYNEDWLKWAILIVVLFIAIVLIALILKKGFIPMLQADEAWLSYLIIGNGVVILFLAKVMKINYPEDRAGMYFIPLVILLLGSLLNRSSKLNWIYGLFLFFPLTFFAKINWNTSVFSPDDRISTAFYTKIRKQLKPNETLSVYPIMGLTYPVFEKQLQTQKHLANIQKDFQPYSDVILTKTTYLFPNDDVSDYVKIAEDKASTHVAYKRKRPFQKSLLFDTIAKHHHSNAEFIPIYSGRIKPNYRNHPLQFQIDGKLKTTAGYKTLNIVVSTAKENGEPVTYEYNNLRWYFGEKCTQFPIHFPYAAERISAEEAKLLIYIWNPDRIWVSLEDAQLQILELTQ